MADFCCYLGVASGQQDAYTGLLLPRTPLLETVWKVPRSTKAGLHGPPWRARRPHFRVAAKRSTSSRPLQPGVSRQSLEAAFSEVRAGLRQMASCFVLKTVTTRRHSKQGA